MATAKQTANQSGSELSLKDIILQSILVIQDKFNCSWEEAEEIKKKAARELSPNGPVTVLQLQEKGNLEEKLTLGCELLDSYTKGGLIMNGITEIAGEGGSGKTQLCLQLCITAQWPKTLGGLGAGVVYIGTEGPFPTLRFHQIVESFQKRFPVDDPRTTMNYASNVFVEKIGDVTSLLDCLNNKIPMLLNSGRARCIIIDSVAALFRSEFETHEGVERAQALQGLGLQLRNLHMLFDAAVICVNQVTSTIRDHRSKTVAALGLAWSNLVTTRFLLSRTSYVVPSESKASDNVTQADVRVRKMEVVFSPYLAPSHWYFVVTAEGVKALPSPD